MMTKLEIEKELLGAVLLNNDHMATVARRVRLSDFSEGLHHDVFEAMLALHSQGHRIDPITVLEEMKRIEDSKTGISKIVLCSSITELVYGARSFVDINVPINALLEINSQEAAEGEWPDFIGQ